MTLHRQRLRTMPTADSSARLASMTRLMSDITLRAEADVRQYQVWLGEKSVAYHQVRNQLMTWKLIALVAAVTCGILAGAVIYLTISN